MSTKAGELLWNRMYVTFPPNTGFVDVDTGLTQLNKSETPTLASRVQVIPMAPTSAWAGLVHSEPFLDPATNTIHVTFSKGLTPEPPFQYAPFNVLFWDPHSIVGPGDADTYNPVV